jgi:Cu2+-exporting ATPase
MSASAQAIGRIAAAPATALLDDAAELARFTRWLPARDGRRTGESSLRLGGMHCAACAGLIEAALRRVDGVVDARVSAAAQSATVQWDAARTRPSDLVRAIEQAGYSAVPDTAAGARALRLQESRSALWRLFVAAFCAMQVMMLATPSYISGPGELAPDLKQLLDWGSWLLALPVMLFAAAPFFAGAWRSLRGGRIGMDVPVALGIGVAFIASSGAAFAPGGPFGTEVYFDSLTMFVSFLLGGRYLEMRARHRAAVALEDTVGRLPETAWRECADGSVEAVSVLRLQRGDTVRVAAGQAFAADGVLLRGATRVDESLLSGESVPVDKGVGATLAAGSMNLDAPVVMRVERVGADTRFEAIVALMREARTQRPAMLRSSDRWAAPFLWSVLLLAAGAAAVWSAIDPSRAVWVAVSVLVVTCPCALSLAVPSALLSATAAMARRGVMLRRLEAIDGLAQMDTLFIDKTGTLTQKAQGGVQMIRVDDGAQWNDATLHSRAASLAAWSTHPVARALAADGAGDGTAWRNVRELPGQGLEARDPDGTWWQLGRCAAASLDERGIAGIAVDAWLSRDGQPLAGFRFAESLRADAAAAVAALQRDGVRVALLSGDTPARVERIGRLLGLSDCRGGLTPDAKLAAVRAAQARGERVAMIGDGINDAPVLAQADTSLAMGEGAQIARAQADGVLVSNALHDLVRARALARRSLRVMRQNLVWAAAYNAACVPLALIGWLPPWAAGLGMATSSLVVVLNSLRLAR